MEFEKETLQAVIDARSKAMAGGGGGVKETAAAGGRAHRARSASCSW